MSAEPLWIAKISGWLSVHMIFGPCHSGTMRMAALCLSYDEVITAPRCSSVRMLVVLVRSPRCFRAIGVDDESGIQVFDECQVRGGVIL